jgi:hypothetical protein
MQLDFIAETPIQRGLGQSVVTEKEDERMTRFSTPVVRRQLGEHFLSINRYGRF